MGKTAGPKAAFAVAHTLLTIIWHLLTHGTTYEDHGADYYTRREDPEAVATKLKRKIEALGYTVALTPAT
jgi:transposase